jgi:hypothetical protein
VNRYSREEWTAQSFYPLINDSSICKAKWQIVSAIHGSVYPSWMTRIGGDYELESVVRCMQDREEIKPITRRKEEPREQITGPVALLKTKWLSS